MAVNITGGTLNSVNNAAISVYRLQNKNGWVTNDQTNLSSYLAALNITGGKLSGGERKGALEIDTAAEKQVAVSGGLFSSDPSAYCVDGKTGVTNSDNATKADYPYAGAKRLLMQSLLWWNLPPSRLTRLIMRLRMQRMSQTR